MKDVTHLVARTAGYAAYARGELMKEGERSLVALLHRARDLGANDEANRWVGLGSRDGRNIARKHRTYEGRSSSGEREMKSD